MKEDVVEREREVDPTGATVGIEVNGKEKAVPEGLSVRDLLLRLELRPELVVVEHNREILDRDRYDRVAVEEGDRFELVHFVGGG